MRWRWQPWYRALRGVYATDAPVMAAGAALFALLAAIPGLAAIVVLYSLIADPGDIAAHLSGLEDVLPDEVLAFVVAQLEREASRETQTHGIALATTLLFALYSARGAVGALLAGLHHTYDIDNARSTLLHLLLTLAVAGSALVGMVALVAVVVALPAVVALLHLPDAARDLVVLLRWPVLLVVLTVGVAMLYRHGPSQRPHAARRVWTGALVATALWLLASAGLSFWVGRVADYENVYGAFASVLVVILWFYLSALAILAGGLVNAELERDAAVRAR